MRMTKYSRLTDVLDAHKGFRCVSLCLCLLKSEYVTSRLLCIFLQLLVLLWLVIEDHDNLFIMAESVHFLGIGLLIYKLMTKKNAGGAPTGPCI